MGEDTSALRYGRDRAAVERDLKTALAQLERQEKVQDEKAADLGVGKRTGKDASGNPMTGQAKGRSEHREKPSGAKLLQEQLELPDPPPGADDTLQVSEGVESEPWREEEPV